MTAPSERCARNCGRGKHKRVAFRPIIGDVGQSGNGYQAWCLDCDVGCVTPDRTGMEGLHRFWNRSFGPPADKEGTV